MTILSIRGVSRSFPSTRGGTPTVALQATDQIIFGIIVIGLIGLVSDFAFKVANRRFFPWAVLGP